MIEVVLEVGSDCPRCHKILARAVRAICEELDIPFFEKIVDAHAVAAEEGDATTRTLRSEWIYTYGSKRQREFYEKHKEILDRLSRYRAYPNLIIRWHDGARMKEIVVRGFPADEEDPRIPPFLRNIRILLHVLKGGGGIG